LRRRQQLVDLQRRRAIVRPVNLLESSDAIAGICSMQDNPSASLANRTRAPSCFAIECIARNSKESALIGSVDDWRFKTRMPSRAAAVRELLKRGLMAEGFTVASRTIKSKDFGVVGTEKLGSRTRAGK